MRILLYTDVHWSVYSSIIRTRGKKYSRRLHNLIQTLNWAESLVISEKCDAVYCLGDFFDKPDLSSEELTALQEITWANCPHTFLVGNHESPVKSLIYNSVKALQNKNFNIINEVTIHDLDNCRLYLIPYLLEEDRKTIKEYVDLYPYSGKKIIFSHNDVKGIRYGAFESKEGFEISDIEANCNLFLNGHLHNSTRFCSNGINLGNLTGQNFGENAFEYSHCAYILDTNTGTLEAIENPYAFNFYQLEIKSENDFKKLDILKNQSIVSIKCIRSLLDNVKEELNKKTNIEESRTILLPEISSSFEEITLDKLNNNDYLEQFKLFVSDKLGSSADVLEEINHIILG